MYMNNICIIRNTFGDRSAFLKISLEYQNIAYQPINNIQTFLFIDPHPENGVSKGFNDDYLNQYPKIIFENHKERKSWYLATKYMFDNYNYEYILSIEDDIIISYDYLKLCNQVICDKILDNHDNILYMHPGAWEEPKGDINLIVGSAASSRSILINRKKFKIIRDVLESSKQYSSKTGNDYVISKILQNNKMKTIAPQYNRHGHFGIYGWSSSGIHRDNIGKKRVFEKEITDQEMYDILKDSCLSKDKLLKLNLNKNEKYFWDFDPNINFTNLKYNI